MKSVMILMLIISSLLLQGQEFKKIEDSLFDNNLRLNSACDTSILILNNIESYPLSYDYLESNNYCYFINPPSNSITFSFTFYCPISSNIVISAGYSVLSCSFINFTSVVLYNNTTCTTVGEGFYFNLEEGNTYTWTITAISNGIVCQGFSTICPYWIIDVPLVIELLSFQGESQNGFINLYWTTATETNSNYFVIEKSSDAINFKEISRVKASGNSIKALTYKAIDNKPYESNNYYRLVEYDFNGVRYEYTIINVYYPYKLQYKVYDIMGLPTTLTTPGFKIIKYENGSTVCKFINN